MQRSVIMAVNGELFFVSHLLICISTFSNYR